MPNPYLEWTDTIGLARLTCLVPTLQGWTPDVEPIGPSEEALGTGTIFTFIFRTDRTVSFTLPNISAAQMTEALRLKEWLINGGQITIATGDLAGRVYTAKLRPKTVPRITQDPENLEFALSLELINTAATPFIATWQGAGVVLTPDTDYAGLGGTFTRALAATYYTGPGTLLLGTEATGVWRRKQYRAGVRTALFEPSDLNNCPRSEDLSTWTRNGAGTATPGQTDPLGTTTAYKLDDTDGANDTNWVSPNFAAYQAAWTTRGFSFFFKADTAAVGAVAVRDVTAAVTRAMVTVTPVAGVLTAAGVVFTTGTGRVVYVVPVTGQPGHYRVGIEVDGLTVANTHCFIVRPAGLVPATLGASIFWGFHAHHLGTPAHAYIANPGASGAITCPTDRMRIPWQTPPGAISFYAKYYETGMQRNAIISAATVRAIQLSSSDNLDPRLLMGMSSGGSFLVQHTNAATGASVSSTLAAPTLVFGDLVEMLGLMYQDGSVQVGAAVNGGAFSFGARTAAKTLPAAWASDGLVASQEIAPWSAFSGFAEALALAVLPGIFTLDEARSLAR